MRQCVCGKVRTRNSDDASGHVVACFRNMGTPSLVLNVVPNQCVGIVVMLPAPYDSSRDGIVARPEVSCDVCAQRATRNVGVL